MAAPFIFAALSVYRWAVYRLYMWKINCATQQTKSLAIKSVAVNILLKFKVELSTFDTIIIYYFQVHTLALSP
jgi:hypothetical protein